MTQQLHDAGALAVTGAARPGPRLLPRSTRRHLLALGGAWVFALPARAQATAEEPALGAALALYTGGAPVRSGRVRLEVETLVDNGNAVPVTVRVDSPMTPAEHVTAIAIFNERNPQRDVARFTLGPRAGRAEVSTRIRLATSQKLVAVARLSDGSFWQHTVDVIVVLAACIEGDI